MLYRWAIEKHVVITTGEIIHAVHVREFLFRPLHMICGKGGALLQPCDAGVESYYLIV